MLALIILTLPLAYLTWSLICLEKHYNQAKQLSVPLVRLPVDGRNLLFQIFGPPIWAVLDGLGLKPFLPQWTVYAQRGWNFEDKTKTAERLGKVWALVTPCAIYLHLSDADALSDVVTRRLEFPRPTKPYSKLFHAWRCIKSQVCKRTRRSLWRA
jgi:hypothetical protein